MNTRELFFRHLAQTTTEPLALEIVKAEGCYLYDVDGKKYLDLVGGISVANTGHRNSKVLDAIKKQLDDYLHIMVYGEFVESPQVQYAQLLTAHLPKNLNTVYFTNSGSEAVEGALKLAKRINRRSGIIAFKSSYHGSTHGALSLMGDENWRNAFRPLLPAVSHLDYNSFESLEMITDETACVMVETVQAEAGIIAPDKKWMQALRQKCTDLGAVLILDEVQAAFGRTGKLWGFENFDIVPDIVILGKALGGGLPLGAFIGDKKFLDLLTENPSLGHITTFGGHPLSCAAGMSAMKVLLGDDLPASVKDKEALFKKLLSHDKIKAFRSYGLWIAIEFDSFETNKKIISHCLEKGVFTDWFLFNSSCMRISPPLTISPDEISQACEVIIAAIKES